jgi:3-oxoacyl-[acyl-carrier-protein] synthase III
LHMSLFARIAGTGSYLPPRRLTNQDMVDQLAAKGLESSDAWIVERTGIHARHFVDEGVNASDLAFEACRRALASAGKRASDVDLIIVATSTPDMVFPSTATILQHKLSQAALADGDEAGAEGGAAFDVQAVCSGFIYAVSVANAMIQTGAATRALVVGAEIFSRLLDFNDRTTCVLFGDGAGAVLLEACEHDGSGAGILATDLHADGKHRDILCTPGTVASGQVLGDPLLKMDGQAVFKLAVGVLEKTARAVLTKADMTEADVDWLVPHQANIRIMTSTAKKLKMPLERVVVTVDQHGNTSAASIPLALDHGVRSGAVKPGQTVLMEGVGGGFTWGAALVRM